MQFPESLIANFKIKANFPKIKKETPLSAMYLYYTYGQKPWKTLVEFIFSKVPGIQHATLLKKDFLSGIFLGCKTQVQSS